MRRGKAQDVPDSNFAGGTFEIMDDPPLVLRRPLSLIGQYAYAATWPYTKQTLTQTVNQQGETVDHDPPIVKKERRLCIVRNDGKMFGDGWNPLSDLGLEVALNEIPPDEKLWSARGVKAYISCGRYEPADVFRKIVAVIDRFIDFERSLADQKTITELVACYILATWFLDAFNVIGFLWPNGESGSGKTQLLALVAELSYLGQLILAGGSYATLRDLADYGATLCFDDAENLADSKKTDPDKRALLLAGNRRGNTVSVKEPTGTRGWRTRFVNTFCPRAFSAIRVPDPILGSRSIVIPLVRTPDRYRADADPGNYDLWPYDRRALLDGLWSLALENLVEIRSFAAQITDRATLSGRNLEPWQAVLTVAAWLDENGTSELFNRLNALSVSYQRDRREIGTDDLATLVIRSLCVCLKCDVVTLCDECDVLPESANRAVCILTADITTAAQWIAAEEELDIEPDSKGIGQFMRRQRFEHWNQGGTHKKGWRVTKQEVARLAKTFGVVNETDNGGSNVTNVTDSHNVTPRDLDREAEEFEAQMLACYGYR